MRRKSKRNLPLMWAELMTASAETIARRIAMMTTGRATPAEYRRMVGEKMKAVQQTAIAAMSSRATSKSLLAPWLRAARRNAKRLRRR
jgi:hypothetical protein